MCFYNDDYDWYAEEWKEDYRMALVDMKCDECGKDIRTGDWMRHTQQWQYDECQLCGDEDDSCKHDYGEYYQNFCCVSCLKILSAIWEIEKEAECPEHARQPSYEGLYEEGFYQNDWSEAVKYAERAISMYPELSTHSQLTHVLETYTDDE